MDASRQSPAAFLRALSCALAISVVAIGGAVLVGWVIDADALTSLIPGYVPMGANTALGLVLAGAAAVLQAAPRRPAAVRRTARFLAALATVLGAATLLELLLVPGVRLDRLLFPAAYFQAESTQRMPETSALALALLGASLVFVDTETAKGRRPAQSLALAAGLLPLQATIGWMYGLEPAAGVSPFTHIALHSGFAFGLLCAAVLLARPDRGLMRAVTSTGPSGFMARRLLPATAVIPVALGWIFLVAGLRAGQYETLVGASFVVVSAIAMGVALVWWNARAVQQMDEARGRAEEAVRDEREWLSTTLASIGDAVVAAGEDGTVKTLNAVAEALTGWPAALAAGRPLRDVFQVRVAGAPVEDPFRWAVREERVADLPPASVLVARSGAEFPVEGCVSPIQDGRGGTAGVVLVFRDTRDRQRVEEERLRLLERERDAREEAEHANRAKDEFIATLSHELRTPLNSVLGWARLLRIGKLDAEGVRRAVEAIERGATTQAQIVDDLLDMSRIVRGQLKLDVRPIDLVPVIEAAIETVRPAAAARDIAIAAVVEAGAGLVAGDAGRLQQVFWNLLTNAIKFTPAGGRVEVRVRPREGGVEIAVRDTGHGIAPEFLPHVFERFRQADSSTTRMHGGLGLGLAIVRHLVEAHGGTVRAESPGPGRGSTFVVALPTAVARPHPRPVEEPAPAVAALPPLDEPSILDDLRILVVDDDRDTLDVMTQLLEQAGAEVVSAASAMEALACLEARIPDVLVSDIGMPGMDGYGLIREVRKRTPEQGGAVPAAALTAFTQSDARQQVLLAGFQLYLAKPIEPAELTRAVAQLAGRT